MTVRTGMSILKNDFFLSFLKFFFILLNNNHFKLHFVTKNFFSEKILSFQNLRKSFKNNELRRSAEAKKRRKKNLNVTKRLEKWLLVSKVFDISN